MRRRFVIWGIFLVSTFPVIAAEQAISVTPYYEIEDPFTINFLRQSEQQAKYLQIKVALKSDDPEIIAHAATHLPMIQDSLRLLFSDQDMTKISSIEGRQSLQSEAFDVINEIFVSELNNANLQEIYFTRFIWQ
ncbi:flagellar protein [Methylophaga frappieri]|uniref:Flagellar protein FliL n=1 Tax=Methylophaga frappieri (strain ATCC BAA-2434 / DSM 25690 / JAM7) TaxID=754477 RepID=I1YHK9_METFJ|nr:flagellar basal body-associated FliL family protein [Methylophaga frappieri]AFJ02402.1 flagellar protein [Methylophaga frappieri]